MVTKPTYYYEHSPTPLLRTFSVSNMRCACTAASVVIQDGIHSSTDCPYDQSQQPSDKHTTELPLTVRPRPLSSSDFCCPHVFHVFSISK